ncbi:transposase [Aggregatibacter actinomycetemcomitans]|uniref:transposase n=1 Tax=Aggregatibacter actinomycetemcomitans TaxID=714 RepID=UPI00077E3E73|nr:transposase [Aggregatibacter actinomycetemcomitans]KYK74180.1 transposase ISPsy8 [Aggregatibacter actinomycetemcomitans serotype e str. SA3096]
MSYSYQFRLKIIKPVTEQDFGIREVVKLHQIPHSQVIYWLKASRERGLDRVKLPYAKPKTQNPKPKTQNQKSKIQNPKPKTSKILKPQMKRTQIEMAETSDFSPQAFKKLKREPALAKADIDYLKKLGQLDDQKRRQKKEKPSKS